VTGIEDEAVVAPGVYAAIDEMRPPGASAPGDGVRVDPAGTELVEIEHAPLSRRESRRASIGRVDFIRQSGMRTTHAPSMARRV
jgi:hypothetical protein